MFKKKNFKYLSMFSQYSFFSLVAVFLVGFGMTQGDRRPPDVGVSITEKCCYN